MGDFSFFDCPSPFYFLLIDFRCKFSVSYKMLHIMFIVLVAYLIM